MLFGEDAAVVAEEVQRQVDLVGSLAAFDCEAFGVFGGGDEGDHRALQVGPVGGGCDVVHGCLLGVGCGCCGGGRCRYPCDAAAVVGHESVREEPPLRGGKVIDMTIEPTASDSGDSRGKKRIAETYRARRDLIRDEVGSLYEQGVSAAEISRRFGVSDYAIGTCLDELGIERRTTAQSRREGHVAQVVRLYEKELLPVETISKRLGIGRDVVRGCLDDAGVVRRTQSEYAFVGTLGRRHPSFSKEISAMWHEGVSVKAMSERLGIARGAVNARIKDLGLTVRNQHQAALIRMTDPEERGRVVRKAHLAMAPMNAELAELLDLLGVAAERERQVGPRNLDLCVGNVAIEVHKSGRHPFSETSRERDRTESLLRRGLVVVYMWINGTCGGPRLGGAKQLVSLLQGADGNPPIGGQYWVIRGCGEIVSVGRDELDEYPAKATHHRICYAG